VVRCGWSSELCRSVMIEAVVPFVGAAAFFVGFAPLADGAATERRFTAMPGEPMRCASSK